MTTQERFAQDWNMPLHKVRGLVSLANNAGKANEHHCNGDRHPLSKQPEDKNHNAKLWGDEVDAYTTAIKRVVEPFGFTDVAYTGLYPTLKRGDQFVEIPY